jgi:molecular chaperone HscA
VDADGLLSVTATETTRGVQAGIQVKPSYGLADDDIARMLQESIATADDDARARVLRERQVEAQRVAEATRAALAADGDLLQPAERQAIDQALTAVDGHVAGHDPDLISAALAELNAAVDEFAARRMDRSIRAALAGRRIDEVAAP